jgi:6-phosphogluconolactonase
MRAEVVSPDALAGRAAVWLADEIWTAVAERGVAHLAVSGGRTPAAMFAVLASLPVPWERVHVWQVDERVAPDGHPDRNANDLHTALIDRVPLAGVHLLDVTASSLDLAASRYAADLAAECNGVLDVVHLGLGDDGHTASWPPGDPVADVRGPLVAVSGEYQGRRRLTLTVTAVQQARRRLVLVAGASKTDAVRRFADHDPSIPAHLVPRAATLLLIDTAAGALLPAHLAP